MNKITKLSKKIKELFTIIPDEVSQITKLIKRKRKLTAQSFFKALIFGNLQDGNCSVESMCQILGEEKIDMSKQGFHFRFSEKSVDFMEMMFNKSMNLFEQSIQINSSILQQFSGVKLIDSTHINLPNNMENRYKGYGSSYKDCKCYTKSGN